MLYLHPQIHLVFHPQFLGNSCDVSLWSSAGHRRTLKTHIRHDDSRGQALKTFWEHFHVLHFSAASWKLHLKLLNFSPWKPSPQWQASGRQSQRCSPTSWQWPELKYHAVRKRAGDWLDLGKQNLTNKHDKEQAYSYSQLWSHWAGRHVSVTVLQCLYVLVVLPGAEECNRAATETETVLTSLSLFLKYKTSN